MYTLHVKQMKTPQTLARMEAANLPAINLVTLKKSRWTGTTGTGKSTGEKNLIIHMTPESLKYRTQLMVLKIYSFEEHSDTNYLNNMI